MENIKRKAVEQENSYTSVLRTLIKQKEEIANKFKKENDQLKKLLFKQQSLLNTLNEDNMQLTQHYTNCNSKDHRSYLIKIKYLSKNINETFAESYAETHDIERVQNENL